MDAKLLSQVAQYSQEYLDSLNTRKITESASRQELIDLLGKKLPEESEDAADTIARLARAGEVGTLASRSPRFFGFVVGGTLPVAHAADWMTTTWDQNAGLYKLSPLCSVAEDIARDWLLQIFDLPRTSEVGFVTGCAMATLAGLAAARHSLLERAGWDVEANGLQGAPKINIVLTKEAHVSVSNSLRVLGLGGQTAKLVSCDNQGRMLSSDLEKVIKQCQGPTIVCAQAGNVNSGAFDPFDDIARVTAEHGGWLHIDGAFGLWAAASPKYSHLLNGADKADSWSVDAHKWLNVPYDCAFAIVKERKALVGSFGSQADYLEPSEYRDGHEYVPEFSRRGRGITVYAALRQLGRLGVGRQIERCCENAKLFESLLSKNARVKILNDVVINQVLVRFDDDDSVTDSVIRQVQEEGICWLSGTKWQGKSAMRISVCNWATTPEDIRASVKAILSTLGSIKTR